MNLCLRGCLAGFHRKVLLACVVIDASFRESGQEALVKFQDVLKVAACLVRSQIARRSRVGSVADSIEKSLCLTEPGYVNGNQVFLSLGCGCVHDLVSPANAATMA